MYNLQFITRNVTVFASENGTNCTIIFVVHYTLAFSVFAFYKTQNLSLVSYSLKRRFYYF